MADDNYTPEMIADLLAMAKEVKTIGKGGWNEKSEYSYAVADAVIKEARELLGKHNMLWMKTSQRIGEPKLHAGDIGRQYYVGEVEISGLILHASGGKIHVTSEIPIVAKGASPHDKSAAASSTFGTGYLLLGVLNADREGKHSQIDDREEEEEPLCVGQAAPIATSNKERCLGLVELSGDTTRDVVWDWACSKSNVPKFDNGYPGPSDLTVSEGKRVGALLKSVLERKRRSLGIVDRESGDDGDVQPGPPGAP